MKGVRIGCAMTGSFCTFEKAFEAWRALGETGAELVPIMSENAYALNTRFYSAEDSRRIFREIAGREILTGIEQVEPFGPKKMVDMTIVSPCTGNTLSKIANGIGGYAGGDGSEVHAAQPPAGAAGRIHQRRAGHRREEPWRADGDARNLFRALRAGRSH